jgi:uncharacterized protein YbjQ (UPF0145 family)
MGKKSWEDIIITDTNDIPGKKIIKTLDDIRIKCDATKDKKVGKLAEFRGDAPNKLKKIAYKLGANSILSARFEYRGGDFVYEGTAAIFENED